ncbi:MAG: hypothetical protein ACR2FL_09555 [Nocardioidaceae bacterium]
MKFRQPTPPPFPAWVLDQATASEDYRPWAIEHGVTVLAVLRARRAHICSEFTSTREEGESR